MRAFLAAVLTLAACSTGAGDGGGTDGADTTDDPLVGDDDLTADERCSGPNPDVPVTLRFGAMDVIEVEGMRGIYHVPEDPQAVIVFFHGGGGVASDLDYLEQWRLYNRAHCNGIAVLAGSSLGENWSDDMPASANPDVPRVEALWAAVDAVEGLPSDLPVFIAGFSDGGGFAPRFADMMAEVGWDIRALTLHNTGAAYIPNFPTAFNLTENDERISPSSIRSRHQDVLDRGLDSVLFEWDEIPLTPERLTLIDTIDLETAQFIYEELQSFDLIGADGERTFDLDSLNRTINTYQDNSEYRGVAKVTRQLRVVWATHRFSGHAAAEEIDFLLTHL